MKEKIDELREKYPTLFSNHEMEPITLFGIEHGPGWNHITEALCDGLSKTFKNKTDPPVIQQIKQKFGTLRVYMSHVDEEADILIDFAESLASNTCEKCGKPGKLNDKGWWMVLCEGCNTKSS